MDPILQEPNHQISNALDHLKKELSLIRAGRANPSLIEEIPVEAYGSKMRLMELGTITAPQTSLLTVQVWDPSIIINIQKALLEANLGLNPSVDGQTIRLPIPPLNEERREEFVKMAHAKGEECRIEIRQIRQEIRDKWKKEEETGGIGEDEFRRRDKILQDLIDKSSASVDEYVKLKEEELRQI